MRTSIYLLILLFPFVVSSQGNFTPTDADLSFPRSIIDSDQVEEIRNTLSTSEKFDLYKSIYIYASNDAPSSNISNEDRRLSAQIAREAAFVILMEKAVINNELVTLDEATKEGLLSKTLSILNNINTEVTFQDGWSFYYTWQFRSKELIHLLIAYDLLKGTDIEESLLEAAKQKLQLFSGNLYLRSTDLYTNPIAGLPDIDFYFYNPNNHGVMVCSALGLAGVVLGECEHDDPNYQPINWINTAMWNLDNLLWRVDGLIPRVSDPNVIAGYAEGPNYFQYGFQNAFPFIRSMWNYLPESSREYEYKGITRNIQNPWYDQNFHNIYHWMTLIRMPDGRFPAIHDSNANMTTNLHALSGLSDYNIPSQNNSNADLWTRAQYISTNVEASDYNWPLFQALPDAGSLIFRSTYNDPSGIYMHLIGKHDIALNGAKAHHQGDAMSFQLFYNNHIFAIEEGYVGAPYREYVNQATDHNLILVNGSGPKAPTSEWVSSDNEVFIENYFDLEGFDYGELTGGWEGAAINRNTLFVEDEYFIIWDLANAGVAKEYQFQLHCSGLAENESSHPNGSVQLKAADHQVLLSKNEDKVLVQTEISSGNLDYKLELDSVFNGVTTSYHNKFLATSDFQSKAQFTSLLYPFSEIEPHIQKLDDLVDGTLLLIDRGSKNDLIFTQENTLLQEINLESNLPITGNLKSNAIQSFFSFEDDQSLSKLFISNGDSIYLNGQKVFTLDQKVNLALEFLEDDKIKGHVNHPCTIKLFSDTSQIVNSGAISEIFYDPVLQETTIHFESATYFEIQPGENFTSSSENDLSETFKTNLFPNPTNGKSILEIKSSSPELIHLSLSDFLGRIIFTQSENINSTKVNIPIDLSLYPEGIYSLTIQRENGTECIKIYHFL